MIRTGRLHGQTAVVVGGGQTPGETIGNGRATAILFAREGARLLLVDRDLASAEETGAMIESEGGVVSVHQADITIEDECAGLAQAAISALGHIDVLHNNVGIAAVAGAPNLFAYKVSKAGVNTMTQSLALANARYGIRVNAIMPGLMDTPMAVDAVAAARGRPRREIAEARDAQVPLQRRMGTGWDVAYAALFLASDEAKFITGALLPVDGGQSISVG